MWPIGRGNSARAAIALALILLLAAFAVLLASRWAPTGVVAGDRDA